MEVKPTETRRPRDGERGAALITALLVSVLLLAAGGALILTTGMTASNAADATAEGQAYYAAESGLQAALAVLRGNVPSSPSGTSPDYRTVVCGSASTCTNSGNMAAWFPLTGGVVPISTSPALSYTLTVRDADYDLGAALPAAPYTPRYLLVTSTGRGPKGARKVLEMKVDTFPFEFTARAAVAIRSSDGGEGMLKLDLGESNPHEWNGNDNATPPGPSLPAFAVTNTADYDAGDGFGLPTDTPANEQGVGEAAIGGDEANVLGSDQIVKLDPLDLETYLHTATKAREFLTYWRAKAGTLGRLNPGSGDIGTEDDPKFSFVDGNLSLGGGDHGAGLLIVTGTLSMGGSSSFKGIVLLLGNGRLERNGTPGALGALVVANFEHVTDPDTGIVEGSGDFGRPYIDAAGGGNSLIGYDSEWIKKAMNTLGGNVVGVVEK